METNKSLVECNNCHKSVSVPLNETMVRCPYCCLLYTSDAADE